MFYNPPIPDTAITSRTHKAGSGRVFYQVPGGVIRQSLQKDGKWIHEDLPIKAVPLSPLASVSWDDHEGEEIRLFYLDNNYVIQGACYSRSKGWHQGKIGQLGIKASPTSRLSAMGHMGCFGNGIHVFYQEANTQAIKDLSNHDGHWHAGSLHLSGALQGTGLATVQYVFEKESQIRVYYQNAEGYLKEYCHNNQRGWFSGEFGPGKAPLRTPINALAFGVHVQLQVYWRDANGHVVFRRHTGHWNPTQHAETVPAGFRFAVSQWESGKHLRIYAQDYLYTIREYCSDDGGNHMHQGEKLTD